jgi:hypothetical protein
MANICRMPIISLIAFEDRTAKFIFVRVPNEFGRYLRTDPCVAHVACERCHATIGEPCRHDGKYVAATHAVRRGDHDQRHKGKPLRLERIDVIEPNDGAHVVIK